MLSQIDAALVSSAPDSPWPSPQDYPPPTPLEVRASVLKLLASGLFALALAGMIALMLYQNAEAYEGWRLWLRILVVAGTAALGVTILIAAANAVLSPLPQVSLAAAGLLIPGLYTRPIPWSEVRLAVHDKPRVKIFGPGRIVIGVRGGARFGRLESNELLPGTRPGALDAAALPQILDVSVPNLFNRMQAFRAHFGRGGEPHNPG